MLVAGVIAVILAFICLKMGHGSLRDSHNYRGYGVETESLHQGFSRIFIVAGWILGAVGAYLVLTGMLG